VLGFQLEGATVTDLADGFFLEADGLGLACKTPGLVAGIGLL